MGVRRGGGPDILSGMRSYEASTRIQASPDQVWGRLVDVSGWRDWNSGVDRVEGRVALGEKITIYATMIRNRPFTVTVTELRPGEAMRWRGGLPYGLAVIERTYHLDGQDDGSTVVTVREDHTGPLAGVLDRSTPDLNPSFRQFVEGLKALAEGRTSRHTG